MPKQNHLIIAHIFIDENAGVHHVIVLDSLTGECAAGNQHIEIALLYFGATGHGGMGFRPEWED